MTCTRGKQHKERVVWRASCVFGKIRDCVIAQIFGEVISGPIGAWCGDMRVVAHYFRAELIGFCIEESVEAVETARKRPAVEWTSGSGFGEWSDMPFAHHVVAVPVRSQNFTECSSFFRDLAAVAGVATVEVGKATNTYRVVITSGEQRRSCCRTHGGGVKA